MLYRLNGKYAIQNAASAGDKFWIFDPTNRIKAGTSNEIKVSNFIFEIVPVENQSINYQVISPSESYYIKSGETYLTNNNVKGSGSFPTFKSLIANNSASQQWTLTVDAATDRYKLASTADTRYVNELGAFGTNAYSSAWNTYVLTEMDNKFAIQNAGSGGASFWANTGGRMTTSAEIRQNSYLFELIPTATLFPSAIDQVGKCSKYSVKLIEDTLYVTGADASSLQLATMGGVAVRRNNNENKLSLKGLAFGVYLLSISSKGSKTEILKIVYRQNQV